LPLLDHGWLNEKGKYGAVIRSFFPDLQLKIRAWAYAPQPEHFVTGHSDRLGCFDTVLADLYDDPLRKVKRDHGDETTAYAQPWSSGKEWFAACLRGSRNCRGRAQHEGGEKHRAGGRRPHLNSSSQNYDVINRASALVSVVMGLPP
jgi:hypothetical protein